MTVVAEWVAAHLSFLPPQAIVAIVSMLPLIELRGGIPVARLHIRVRHKKEIRG